MDENDLQSFADQIRLATADMSLNEVRAALFRAGFTVGIVRNDVIETFAKLSVELDAPNKALRDALHGFNNEVFVDRVIQSVAKIADETLERILRGEQEPKPNGYVSNIYRREPASSPSSFSVPPSMYPPKGFNK